jgi:RTX calcium-binding nonapeptide repeat (4 copies)
VLAKDQRRETKTMKSIMVLLTAVMVALMMSAPVALAPPPIYCTQAPDAQPECKGTNGNDVMYGYDNDNNMYGLYGDDYIFGFGGDDYLHGGGDNDWVYGGAGDERLLDGGLGDDHVYGDAGSDRYFESTGNDRVYDRSSSSSDTYFGDEPYFGEELAGNDQLTDYGGYHDVLDLDGLARSDVAITWVKLLGTGTSLYALRIQQRGTNDILLVRNYFNNTSGPPSKGPGAIESIKFKDKTVGFPASQG